MVVWVYIGVLAVVGAGFRGLGFGVFGLYGGLGVWGFRGLGLFFFFFFGGGVWRLGVCLFRGVEGLGFIFFVFRFWGGRGGEVGVLHDEPAMPSMTWINQGLGFIGFRV